MKKTAEFTALLHKPGDAALLQEASDLTTIENEAPLECGRSSTPPVTPSASLPLRPVPPEPPRCKEKGCVFPATKEGAGFCIHHRRQETEPSLFSSLQPTWFVVYRSADSDRNGNSTGRIHDRHRLAAQSRAFQQGRV